MEPAHGKRNRGRPKTTWRRTMLADLKQLGLTIGEAEAVAKDRNRWRNLARPLAPTVETWVGKVGKVRPVATAIIKFNSHLGFTTTHPWNPYSAHVITWNSNGAQCFKYWRKQKNRQLLNKHVKSENDGICCGMWHIVRWAHENKCINKKKASI